MSALPVRRLHIDMLLALFHILDIEAIDPETLSASFLIPSELARATLDRAEALGYVEENTDRCYEETPRGKRISVDLDSSADFMRGSVSSH